MLDTMGEWQNRPLDAVYLVMFIDAISVNIREGQIATVGPSPILSAGLAGQERISHDAFVHYGRRRVDGASATSRDAA